MIEHLSKIFIIIFFSSFPLLLWGYGATFLSHHAWDRKRFWSGMAGGTIAVIAISLFQKYLQDLGSYQIIAIITIFILLAGIVWGVTSIGSPFIRGFLRRTVLIHIGLFSGCLIVFEFVREYFSIPSDILPIVAGVGGYLIAASLEEGVKHVSSIGLTAREFRFSQTDFLLFTFFITLGFVFAENLIYLVRAYDRSIGSLILTGLSRGIMSSMIHIFAASICVMMWWKALSYGVFSWKYIVLFISGFIMATGVHALYNTLLERGYILSIIVLCLGGYVAFTQWLTSEER